MINDLKVFFSICSLKNKIALNALKSKANSGKAFALIFGVICTIWAVSDFSSDASSKIITMPYGSEIIRLLFSFIVLCLCFVTFTGDLSLGHSIGTGQLSKDFYFLRTMPIKPLPLIASKLYERFISDYFGFLVMFSFFIGISCRNGISLSGVAVATVLYLQLSLFIGLLINLIMIVLSHFFKKTTTENIFSAIGYISAFSILLPFLAFNSQPQQTLNKIAEIIKSCGDIPDIVFAPFVWVSECLIQSGFSLEFIKFSCLWSVLIITGCYFYMLAVNNNWFNQRIVVNNKIYAKQKYSLFKGMLGKEFKLLKSDFNMLFNAIFMPITVIAVEIYLMKNTFSFTSINSIKNMIFASIIYFCLFGPVNCVGGEGKAISFVETVPLTPEYFIEQKFLAWFLVAEIVFLPTSFVALYMLNFSITDNLKAVLAIAFFTAVCVFGAVCVSAICANYSAKTFPQRSSILGKLATMALLSVAVAAKSFVKLDILSFLSFIFLLVLVFKKACISLKYRLDEETREYKLVKINYALFLVSYLAATVTILQFFAAVIPGINTGPWAYSLPFIIICPLFIIYFSSFNKDRKHHEIALSENSTN